MLGTWYTINLSQSYYGFGFVVAAIVLYLMSLWLLYLYTEKLDYNIFTKQPVFFIQKRRFFTRMASRLEDIEVKR